MGLRLEPLMGYSIDIGELTTVGGGPLGTRVIANVVGGKFEGSQLRGRVHHSGGDWALVGPDGFARLDVRLTLETDDGAFVYLSYVGFLEFNERAMGALQGGQPTEYGEVVCLTQPRFETGDERYGWLNTVVAVGEGRLRPGAVDYEVYRVRQD